MTASSYLFTAAAFAVPAFAWLAFCWTPKRTKRVKPRHSYHPIPKLVGDDEAVAWLRSLGHEIEETE